MGQCLKLAVNFGANLTTKFNLKSAINKNYILWFLFLSFDCIKVQTNIRKFASLLKDLNKHELYFHQ